MKRKTALIGAAALAAASLVACGDHPGMSVPTMPTAQALDTAQVLALAQKSSEVSVPIQVNDGALTLTDSSESAEAISVNGM
jgi:type IV pilus biogenesis protein CpaD/CtpE